MSVSISRRRFIAAALPVLGLSVLSAAGKRKLTIGYQPYCLPYMQGNIIRMANVIDKFLPANVTVEWSRTLAGVVITNDMVAGRTDIGLMGDSPGSIAVDKGAGIVIGCTGYDNGEGGAIVARTGVDLPTYKGPIRFGTPFGSFSHRQLLTFLKRRPLYNAELLNLDIRLQVSRLQNETIEACATWEPYPSYIERLGLGYRAVTGLDIARCSCMDYNQQVEQHNLRVIGVVTATKQLLERHRDIAVGYMAAVHWANTTWVADPDTTAKLAWSDVKDMPKSVIRAGIDMYVPDIRLNKNVLAHLDGVGKLWADKKLVAPSFQFQYDTTLPAEAIALAARRGVKDAKSGDGFPALLADHQKKLHSWKTYARLDDR